MNADDASVAANELREVLSPSTWADESDLVSDLGLTAAEIAEGVIHLRRDGVRVMARTQYRLVADREGGGEP